MALLITIGGVWSKPLLGAAGGRAGGGGDRAGTGVGSAASAQRRHTKKSSSELHLPEQATGRNWKFALETQENVSPY